MAEYICETGTVGAAARAIAAAAPQTETDAKPRYESLAPGNSAQRKAGQPLGREMLKSDAMLTVSPSKKGVIGKTGVVLFVLDPLKDGVSARLPFSKIHIAIERHDIGSNELVWNRSSGRPLNRVIRPAGWVLVNSSVPVTIKQTDNGRSLWSIAIRAPTIMT